MRPLSPFSPKMGLDVRERAEDDVGEDRGERDGVFEGGGGEGVLAGRDGQAGEYGESARKRALLFGVDVVVESDRR